MKYFKFFVFSFTAFSAACAFADNSLPKVERERIASVVGSILQIEVSPNNIHASQLPFYEARLPSGPIFISKDASWMVQGNLIDVAKRESLTEKSIGEMQKIDFSSISNKNALKFVKGNGRRKVITFEDPNCGYCKKFAEELKKLDNATVYIHPVAMIAPSSESKVVNVLCSDNPSAAWTAMLTNNKNAPDCKSDKKQAATKKMQAIQQSARDYFVTGTPTIFFEDNTRVNGYIPFEDLDNRLSKAKNLKIN